jgi:MFS family permease
VFSTSFLARPLGSLLIGVHADRFGRQRALAAMILLMAAATAAIGLLPPWSAIGVAAPACLVILRIVQGFSSGGEISTSIAFLVESARPVAGAGTPGGTWHRSGSGSPAAWQWQQHCRESSQQTTSSDGGGGYRF